MSYGARILIVEDDLSIGAMLTEYLGEHGFEVRHVVDGAEMRAEIECELPDLVLLDIHLPGEDGITLARHLRARFDLAIIIVTGANELVDRVVGLEVGADDYVSKPFDPRELLARIKSVLRRVQPAVAQAEPVPEVPTSGSASTEPRKQVGRCWLEPLSRRLWSDSGEEIPLTAMEFELLSAFIANPNRVLSRDQLLMRSRNREWEPFDRSIDIRIGRLRRKVERDPAEPTAIRTVRGGGYMFVPG